MSLLEEKIAVITGSTKGIGRAIAIEFAREGAYVIINHRKNFSGNDSSVELNKTVALLEEVSSKKPLISEADCTNEIEIEKLAQNALQAFGKIDIWVNNVGSHIVTPALNQTKEEWEQLFSINATSTFLGCREAARTMLNNGGGAIINIASKMGLVGSPENACYCSAKAAVIMMTRCLAAEWADKNIRVNAIAPGVTITDPTYAVVEGKPALEAALHYRIPMERFANPEEIAKTAVFLASDLSSYVTGETISCDGGWVANGDFAGIPVHKINTWREEFPKLKK
jgi:3-oxoacyl-[acyl-carrier protein] reductase